MSRWVIPESGGLKAALPGGGAPEGPLDRIAKYIPGEIVSAFTVLFSSLVAMNLEATTARWAAVGLMILFLSITFVYIATQSPVGTVRKAHMLVSPIAFLAWAYPISSSLLGNWFIGLASFAAMAVVIALSIVIKPS